MTRPLVYFLIYLILGIIFGQHFYEEQYAVIFLAFIIISSLIIFFLKKTKIAFIFIIFFLIGTYNGKASVPPNEPALYDFALRNEKTEMICQVIDITKKSNNVTGYVVKAEYINGKKYSSKALLYTPSDLIPGDEIKVYGKIKNIPFQKNPTDFDIRSYYRSLNIEYKIYPDNLEKTDYIINTNSVIKSCRNYFEENFDKLLPQRESSFMKSVVLGNRSELDDDLYNTFKIGGVSHIVAISGLHISIISGIILFYLKKININFAYITTFMFLAFYAVFSGLSPSVVRAVLMTLVLFVGYMLGRDYDVISAAALICITMLIYNCYYIYNIGFCYSFMCVFGIGMMIDILRKLKPNKILQTIFVSFAANICAKPITIYSFYYVYLWDIISNIIIVPLMFSLIVTGIVSNLLSIVCLPLAKIIILYDYYLIHFYEFVCEKVSLLPYYEIQTGGISVILLITLYLSIITIYNCIMNKKNTKYIALLIILFSIIYYRKTDTSTAIIDTERSKTSIIINKDNCILINCGSVPRANYGKYRILNYLKYKNVKNIDKIFITKTNYYYMGGIMEICDNINIDTVCIMNNCDKKSYMYKKLMAAAENKNIKVEYVDKISY